MKLFLLSHEHQGDTDATLHQTKQSAIFQAAKIVRDNLRQCDQENQIILRQHFQLYQDTQDQIILRQHFQLYQDTQDTDCLIEAVHHYNKTNERGDEINWQEKEVENLTQL